MPAVSAATLAIAIFVPSVGDRVPLVTRPTDAPSERHVVAGARDRVVDHLEPDELPRRPRLLDGFERVAPDEVSLLELDDPPRAGLERVRASVELVAVERHPGLEPQRIARAEPAGTQPGVAPAVSNRLPNPRVRRLGEELEAVLPGVAGPATIAGTPAIVPWAAW